jgi:hypothetical protein
MLISSPLKTGFDRRQNLRTLRREDGFAPSPPDKRPRYQSFCHRINIFFAMVTRSRLLDLEILRHGILRIGENARLAAMPPHKACMTELKRRSHIPARPNRSGCWTGVRQGVSYLPRSGPAKVDVYNSKSELIGNIFDDLHR